MKALLSEVGLKKLTNLEPINNKYVMEHYCPDVVY